jgi:hypothetical protein
MNSDSGDNRDGTTDHTNLQHGNSNKTVRSKRDIKQLRLEIPQTLHDQGIIQDFLLNDDLYFIVQLNHEYGKKTIPFQFDFRHYQKSLESFEHRLVSKGIDDKHLRMLMIDTVDDNHDRIIEFLKSCEIETKEEVAVDNQIKDYVQRKSSSEFLAEAVVIGGVPTFLVSRIKDVGQEEGEISICNDLEIGGEGRNKLKPFEVISYINKAYTFSSEEEVYKTIDKTKRETLDSLYQKVKSIWKKFIDADDFHISICAADTIFTYYQDRLGLTHYLFFVGDNASGKSNNLVVFHFLAYRNMMSTGVTSANIYQFLGSKEEGLGTICEDEADNIDEDTEKMRIYKNGYTTGSPVLRTDTSYGRKQYRYNTFGFKAFAAEKFPDSLKAKGFRQRIIELPCTYGFPRYDISEVINPAGEQEYKELLDELNDLRNTLLVFRLLHHRKKIPNIRLNIRNREKQLFKPMLRLFQGTRTQKELLPVVSKYISERRKSNTNTLQSFLYRIIASLIKTTRTLEHESKVIWAAVKEALPGESIPNKPLSYDSEEFGVISQKQITEILHDVFGAKKSKHHGSGVRLVFDKDRMVRLGRVYELRVDVKVTEQEEAERDESGYDGEDGYDLGIERYISKENRGEENRDLGNKSCNNYKNVDNPCERISPQKYTDTHDPLHDPPQHTHHTQSQNPQTSKDLEGQTIDDNRPMKLEATIDLVEYAYWISSMGKWGCKNCSYKDDKFGMESHLLNCKGIKK